jgi:plastocyanin
MFAFNLNRTSGEIIKELRNRNVHFIDITYEGFSPEILYVSYGDIINWKNMDLSFHTVTSNEWGSPLLDYQDNYSIIYNYNYEIEYFSILNPKFRGKIVPLN